MVTGKLPGPVVPKSGGSLRTRLASEIETRPVEWLWPNRIPLGKLTVIAGDPKTGKSHLTMFIAAVVSAGLSWPDEGNNDPAHVLLLSAEDDAADTIVPRLRAARADCARVTIVDGVPVGSDGDRLFALDQDLSNLEAQIVQMKQVRLIIIDPISAYFGKADGNDNQEVRRVLAPLAKLAEEHRIAIIGVTHLNKPKAGTPRGISAMYRVMGSLGVTAAARSVWLVAIDSKDTTRRLFLNVGMNLAKDPGGLAFRIVETPEGSTVEFDTECVNTTADDAIASLPKRKTEKTKASEFIRETLARGPISSAELTARAAAEGISVSTLNRARTELGVVSEPSRDASGRVTCHNVRIPDRHGVGKGVTAQIDDVESLESLERLEPVTQGPPEVQGFQPDHSKPCMSEAA